MSEELPYNMLEALLAKVGNHPDKLKNYCVRKKFLTENQELSELPMEHAMDMIVWPEEANTAIKHAIILENERKALREAKRKERVSLMRDICPVEYSFCTKEESPKPNQFDFVQNYWYDYEGEDRKSGLFLVGKPRTGKTAAARALWMKWGIENWDDDPPLFLKTVRLADLAKTKFVDSESKRKFDEVFNDAMTNELVVLDDLATEKGSKTTEAVFYELLDERTENDRRTIITCNLSPSRLAATFSALNTGKLAGRLEQYFLKVDFDA